MPSKSLRFCLHHGCKNLTHDGYCTEHAGEAAEKRRASWNKDRAPASERGYDGTWAKARKMYLGAHPLCEMCEGKGSIKPAEVVHHIRPIDKGGARLDESNMMSLCRDCHEVLHGRKKDPGGMVNPYIPSHLTGC